MISLKCTHCAAAIQMDDAFAGSACRCQQCGAIQTVPGKKRAAVPAGASSKTLYTKQRRTAQSGSGLDELADIVTSSGLTSGLRYQTQKAKRGSNPDRSRNTLLVAVGAFGALILVLVVVVIFLLARSPVAPPTAVGPAGSSAGATATKTKTPEFCKIPLNGSVVVYLLDRGSSARESLGYSVGATLNSLRSLSSDRKFQVIFWDNGQGESAYPAGSPVYATPEAVNAAQRTLNEVVAFGRSDVTAALTKALAAKPDVIVLVTAKGWELDDGFTKSVLSLRGNGATRIATISIGGSGGGEALEQIAKATGGTYKALSAGELKEHAE